METNNLKNNNGLKVVVAFLSLIGICFGMIRMSVMPVVIQQQGVKEDLVRVENQAKEALRDHITLAAHHGAEGRLTRVEEKRIEIETQFDGAEKVENMHVASLIQKIEAQGRIIEKLERKVEDHNELRVRIEYLERANGK